VSRFSLAYCRAICIFALVEILAENILRYYPCVIFVFLFNLRLLISNKFSFCFSNSGWAVGPSGGIVEPDLVTRMRLDESSDGHFSYGPSLGLFREPFSNERYLFSDSQFHTCGPYLEMEKKFFSDNAAIVREVYFDADLLLGVDPEEDLTVEEAVNYEDLVPEVPAEQIQWQHAAVNDILNMEIVRVTPVNSDSEDEETMERVTSPVVVEAVGDLADGSEATGSADIGVNDPPNSVIAAEGVYVEEIVEGRAEAPSDPGPFSEDVTMDDFLPRPRRGSVLFLSFSEAADDEVILYFLFSYPVVYFLLLNSGA
jgi:hypothetical protein